jgi:hypothetical protein
MCEAKVPPDEPTLTAIWELITANHGYRIFHKLIRYIPERIEHRERWVGALQKTPVPMLLIDGMIDPISGLIWSRTSASSFRKPE